jgi:hypothetical protein
MILTFSRILLLQMAHTKRTARKSTGGRAPHHQLAPREPRPEPTEVERLRAELAKVTAVRNTARRQLEQVIRDRDQEILAVQRLTVVNHNCQRMLVRVMNQRNEA